MQKSSWSPCHDANLSLIKMTATRSRLLSDWLIAYVGLTIWPISGPQGRTCHPLRLQNGQSWEGGSTGLAAEATQLAPALRNWGRPSVPWLLPPFPGAFPHDYLRAAACLLADTTTTPSPTLLRLREEQIHRVVQPFVLT
jgi:hypothetical protein